MAFKDTAQEYGKAAGNVNEGANAAYTLATNPALAIIQYGFETIGNLFKSKTEKIKSGNIKYDVAGKLIESGKYEEAKKQEELKKKEKNKRLILLIVIPILILFIIVIIKKLLTTKTKKS